MTGPALITSSQQRVAASLRLLLLLLAIKLLQNIKRLFALSAFRKQPLAITEVLNPGQKTTWRIKVHQHPRGHSCERRNFLQHLQLVLEKICLILLSEAGSGMPMFAVERAPAELAHDQRLVICEAPLDAIGIFRRMLIPADIFVQSQNIEKLPERVAQPPGIRTRSFGVVHGRCDQAGRIELPYVARQRRQEIRPRRPHWSLVG